MSMVTCMTMEETNKIAEAASNAGYVVGYKEGFELGKQLSAPVWHPMKRNKNGKLSGYPKEDGKYLVIWGGIEFKSYDVMGFSNNLHKIDKYDFPTKKKGFYNYGDWGYYDYDDVIAWMEVPKYDMDV